MQDLFFMDIKAMFPLIDEIKDEQLKVKTVKALEKAITVGKWAEEDLKNIPFTLLIPEIMINSQQPMISLVDHINMVTKTALCVLNIYDDMKFCGFLNNDEVICGALLHDIGKFLEYEKDANNKIVQSKCGKILRHPALGLELVAEFNFPPAVKQAIVFHSKEGKEINLLPEVEIVSRADFLNFIPVKKILQNC